jgi:hypothetical protein
MQCSVLARVPKALLWVYKQPSWTGEGYVSLFQVRSPQQAPRVWGQRELLTDMGSTDSWISE